MTLCRAVIDALMFENSSFFLDASCLAEEQDTAIADVFLLNDRFAVFQALAS